MKEKKRKGLAWGEVILLCAKAFGYQLRIKSRKFLLGGGGRKNPGRRRKKGSREHAKRLGSGERLRQILTNPFKKGRKRRAGKEKNLKTV